jgi:GNAT superfamily N-acetyltransferase
MAPSLVDRLEETYLERLTEVLLVALQELAAHARGRLEDATVPAVTAAAFDPGRPLLSPSDWIGLLGGTPAGENVADVMGDIIVDSSTNAALVIGTNVSDQVVIDTLQAHLGNIESWGPSLAASVQQALGKAASLESTMSEARQAIMEAGPFSEADAASIARTELAAAANGGMHAGWVASGVLTKYWRTVHDARVRLSHALAEGQKRPVQIPFTVGGWEAMYPGDPQLPVSQRVNCRCTMTREGQAAADLDSMTKDELYGVAGQLGITGRGRMNKDRLREEIDRYRNGLAGVRLDELTRNQLLQRAKLVGVKGRHRMNKGELASALRGQNPTERGAGGRPVRRPSEEDQFRTDNGYASRAELVESQRLARRKMSAATKLGNAATAEPSGPGDKQARERARKRLFEAYGGDERGYVVSPFSGAKLHWTNDPELNPHGYEVMSRVRLDRRLGFEDHNVVPAARDEALLISRRAKAIREAEEARAVPNPKPASAYKAMGYHDRGDLEAGVRTSDIAERLNEKRPVGKGSQAAEEFDQRLIDLWGGIESAARDPRGASRQARADLAALNELIRANRVPSDLLAYKELSLAPDSPLRELLGQRLAPGTILSDPVPFAANTSEQEALRGIEYGLNDLPLHLTVRVPGGTEGVLASQVTGNSIDSGLYLPPGTQMRVVTRPTYDSIEGSWSMTVEVVPTVGDDRPMEWPKGRDPRFLEWGTRGTELAAAVDTRPRLETLTAETAPAAYNVRLGGYSTAVEAAESRGGTTTVQVAIRDGGTKIGEYSITTETLESPDGGSYVRAARIDRLVIDPSRRGEGVTSAVLRDLEDYYAGSGVESIDMTATGYGGFGLARRGWDFDIDAPEMARIGSYLAGRLTQNVPAPVRAYLEPLTRGIDRTDRDVLQSTGYTIGQLREIADVQRRLRTLDPWDPEYPTPIEVAQVGYRSGMKEWPGKGAMQGATWPARRWLVGPEEE